MFDELWTIGVNVDFHLATCWLCTIHKMAKDACSAGIDLEGASMCTMCTTYCNIMLSTVLWTAVLCIMSEGLSCLFPMSDVPNTSLAAIHSQGNSQNDAMCFIR